MRPIVHGPRALLRRLHGCERGQALVEFALITPILMIIVLGIVDFARAWNAQQVITDAAREGARILAVYDADPAVREDSAMVIINDALLRGRFDPADATITATAGIHSTTVIEPSTVTITYPYHFGFVGRLVTLAAGTNQIELKTSFSMRTE